MAWNALLAVWIGLALLACGAPAPAGPPNVVLVLADDVGYGDVRAYNPDSKVELPTLEALARRGMVFTDAHAPATVCAPTRYSVLTGNYPWRGRLPWGTWRYNHESQVLDGQRTLGDLMQRAGYETALIGKFQLGGHFHDREDPDAFALAEEDPARIDFARRFRRGPLDLGFDHSFILPVGIQLEPYAYFEDDRLVGDPEDLTVLPSGEVAMPGWDPAAVGPELTRRALDFLDARFARRAGGEPRRPFFLYYCSQAIHVPIRPAAEIQGTPVRGRTFHPVGDFLYELDVTLGKILEKLEEQGERSNTLVLVTSDNGAFPHADLIRKGHEPNAPLVGDKGHIWEGGHRVPLIAAWPGNRGAPGIRPGSSSDALVGLQDVYATLAELVGVPLDPDEALDSRSFLPVLRGETGEARRSLLVQGFFVPIRDRSTRLRVLENPIRDAVPVHMLRDGPWKLIVGWRWNTGETAQRGRPLGLFDLAGDPREERNLVRAAQHRARVQRMLAEYREVLASERTVRREPSPGAGEASPPREPAAAPPGPA